MEDTLERAPEEPFVLIGRLDEDSLGMPGSWVRDVRRRMRIRLGDLT